MKLLSSILSTFARFPSVISSTFAGSNLVAGNWKSIIIIYLVTFLLVGLAIFIFNKFDKSKTTSETLKTIQKGIK